MSTLLSPDLSTISPINLTKQCAQLVTIWPGLASWLLQFNTSNRPLRRDWVKNLVRDMASGDFSVTGDTIKFSLEWGSRDGANIPVIQLVDGQHRLTAIVESGVSADCYVVTGLDPKAAFGKTDVGQRRTGADWLHVLGEQYATLLSCAVDNSWRYCTDRLSASVSPSPAQRKAHLDQHPGLRDSVEFARKHTNPTGSIGMTAALHYHCGKFNKAQADEFFTRFGDGAGLSNGDPVLTLRSGLLGKTTTAEHRRTWYKAALIIKAWNAFREGRRIKCLKFGTVAPNVEQFPEIR